MVGGWRGFAREPPLRLLWLQVLEVCVENVGSAVAAWRGGARRVELCSCLCLGGLTPSLGLFVRVRKLLPAEVGIFVMIRANQSESFVYGEEEVEVMVEDVKVFGGRGASGFVFGCLEEGGGIDEGSCRRLLEAAGGLPSTFHRAFDIVRNPKESLRSLIRLGFSRVLTSGQEGDAYLGRGLIEQLVAEAEGSGLIVVAGKGITPGNLREILERTGVKEYHSSARGSGQQGGIYATEQAVVEELVGIGESFLKQK